jgi:predicted thioesterase
MGSTLQPGLRHSAKAEVSRDRTFDFMGEQARVYATPMLVHDIEMACRELPLKHLDPGQHRLGTRLTGKAAKAGLS